MPVVQVKGVANPIQFPDDMDITDIRQVLRDKFSQQALSGGLPTVEPLAQTAQPVDPTLSEKIGQGLADFLVNRGIISNRQGAQLIGQNLTALGEFLPGIGDVTAGDEFGRAVAKGDNVGVALSALGAIPVVGDVVKKSSSVVIDRLKRAEAQGFNIKEPVFHGTNVDFTDFDPSLAGTRGERFGDAIFFSSDPEVASGFSVSLSKNKEFADTIDKANEITLRQAAIVREKGIKSKEFKTIRDEAALIESKRARLQEDINRFKAPTTGSNVRPVFLSGDFSSFDAKGKHFSQVNDQAIREAKANGKDGVIIRNSEDRGTTQSPKSSDVTVVFDPKNVKSIFENF